MSKKFVHLHTHSEYSLLDGMSKVKGLLSHVKELGMDKIALTDHGVMYGTIEFYKKAADAGVKPIIGMEAYTTNVELDKRPERGKFKNFHLVLLAKNNVGYKNLMKLTSIAHVDGYYYRPRITREILAEHSEGLICTSSCPAGELANALIDGTYEDAKKVAQWYADVFKDDYYLEVQRHNYHDHVDHAEHPDIKKDLQKMSEIEKTINEGVVKLSRDMGIPVVATNDAHYIKKEDATAQDALVCIATGKLVSDLKRLRFIDTPEYYIKSPEEMEALFPDLPDALENTVKVADKCEIEIKMGQWYFPKVKLPKGTDSDSYLKKLCVEGLKEKYDEITPELKKRLAYELKVILGKGYGEYFLVYRDMAFWSRERRIPTNIRGSVAGSLVSYALGITTVDPIKYNLPFERFLNPFRPSAPDIDMDIADDMREDMINYLKETYGEDKVAQICTFGRMLARGAVRDVARVLGYPYQTGDQISKLIPMGSQGFPMTIERALEESEDLKTLYDTNADAKRVIDHAKQIEGNARHISVHAGGVVITPEPLVDFTPVQKEPQGDKIITQYEMHACEDIGLVKLDVLGIRNLSILREAVIKVEETTGEHIDLLKIPLDDKKTYEMLSNGETMGVFQLSGSGMTRYLSELKPEKIEDIMMMIALFRPGPMMNIDEYIARKRGDKPVEYYHPKMEKFLDKSLGVLVYQDDLLYTAIELAGYDWLEVDKFRKAVGKKIPEEMARQHVKFVEGCQTHSGMTKEEAEGLWALFEPFQGYGFNKAHSASYGFVAYQTAYMKSTYPVQYMAALLSAESGDTDKISAAISECRRVGIKVLPPDINESGINFTIVKDDESLDDKAIRFGLGAIKNVGEAAIEKILEAREESRFVSFPDFISRVDGRKVNKRVIESLIKVGAMSEFGTRASLLESVDEVRNKVAKPKGFENQQGLFGDEEIKTSMRTEPTELMFNAQEFTDDEMADFERQLMGFALSAKPVSEVLGPLRLSATHSIGDIVSEEVITSKTVKVAAVVEEVRVIVTKKSGKEMAFVKCKDDTGSVDLVVFPKVYDQTKTLLFDNQALLISGKLDSRDDSTSILVDTLDTPESLKNTDGEFLISIPSKATPEQMKSLKHTLLGNPGSKKVSLVFEGKDKKVDLKFGIAWSEALSVKISSIFETA